jgi:hypothetical protein
MPLSVPPSDSRAPPNSDTVNQNNDNPNNSTTTSPFRNSSSSTTTDGVATTILENTKLTLPPPSDGIVERIVTFPNNGAIQINPSDGGSITYTPNANFVGTDTFTIQQCPSNKSNDAIQRNDDACQSFTVIVQVLTSVDNESSSSSNGYYGLVALVVVLPLLIGYGMYRKQKDAHTGSSATNYSATSTSGSSKNNDVSSATVPVAAEPRGSDIADPNTNRTMSSNVLPAAIRMVEPQAQLIHEDGHAVTAAAYHYSVTQKDQCRPVIPPPPTAIANAVAVVIPYATAQDAVPELNNVYAKSLCEL